MALNSAAGLRMKNKKAFDFCGRMKNRTTFDFCGRMETRNALVYRIWYFCQSLPEHSVQYKELSVVVPSPSS